MNTIAIYALIYSDNLDLLENILDDFSGNNVFRRIEQNSVLLFESDLFSFSLEPSDNGSYYMSGSYNGSLDDIQNKLITKK